MQNRNEIAEALRHIHADRYELANQIRMANPRPDYMLNLIRGIKASALAVEKFLTDYATDEDSLTTCDDPNNCDGECDSNYCLARKCDELCICNRKPETQNN